MLMKYHIIQAMLYNHNYSDFESEKQRFIKTVTVELLNKLLKGQVKSLMKTNATVS